MNNKIPIVILNRDRLYPLIQQVNILRSKNYNNIIIIDNQSTYEPLLNWYISSGLDVFYNYVVPNSNAAFRDLVNIGHPKFKQIVSDWYVFNDSDIVPMDIVPDNFISDLMYFAVKYNKPKVGMSIKIDDINLEYPLNKWAHDYELSYWNNPIIEEDGIELYPSPIDTTFSIHSPGTSPEWSSNTLRVGAPYIVKHAPFYYDPNNLPEDEKYYLAHMHTPSSNWSSKIKTERQL